MKKVRKNLARKILCGLLAAGVVGVGGSALAQSSVSSTSANDHKTISGGNSVEFTDKTIQVPGYSIKTAIYVKNGGQVDVKADIISFKGIETPVLNNNGTSNYAGQIYNAGWLDGNGTINLTAKELYVGSINDGKGTGDDGFQMKGANNHLNIIADKIVSYTGDSFINAQGDPGSSTVNIGTAEHRVGHFEAHTTWGKQDYGVAILQANEGNTINLYADKAILDGSANDAGGVIGTGGYGTVNVNTKDLTIDGNICGTYGTRNDPSKKAELNIVTDTLNMKGNVNIGSAGSGSSNFSRNTEVNIKVADKAVIDGNINVLGNSGTKDNTADSSTLNIEFNGDSQIKGDINVKGSTETQNATVNLGGTGDMTASKGVFNVGNSGNVNFTGGKWAVNEWKGDGTGDAAIGEKATVNIEANAMKTETLAVNGTANLIGGNAKVETKNLSGDNGTVTTDSLDNSISAGSSTANGLTVQGTGDIADAIQRDASNAQKLADVVSTGEGEAKKSVASEVKTAEGKVGGAYYAKVDEHGNIDTASEVHAENTTNRAITDMASISIMTWRAENNDMNKRLGELRDSKGEHGAWARMARGESKYGAQNVKNQYNYYQVGYDEKLSVDPNWTVGVALTRTEGNSTFTNGSGENKHTGFAVYGSYLADNGSFIDLIAKYARMDNDYKTVTGAGSGDYETNGYSLSAEYGKRFTKDNGFWIEPQVELTYGKISSADYLTANKVQVNQGDTNSIVGRLGFSLGKDIKQGNVYVRASYLYDFDGETDVKMVDTATGTPASYKQDLGGGWWEVGVGTNLNLSEATHLYFDVEKTYGGNVATPWQWNAGVRWSF